MTLADTIVAALAAATWTTITEPTLYASHDRKPELEIGKGWVWSGRETVEPNTLGNGNFGPRETPFEIYIACSTDANNLLYEAAVETFCNAISVTGGWIEMTEYIHDDYANRHDFHAMGKQVRIA